MRLHALRRYPMDMGWADWACHLGHTLRKNTQNANLRAAQPAPAYDPAVGCGNERYWLSLRRHVGAGGCIAAFVGPNITAEAEGVAAVGHCARSRHGNRAACFDITYRHGCARRQRRWRCGWR